VSVACFFSDLFASLDGHPGSHFDVYQLGARFPGRYCVPESPPRSYCQVRCQVRGHGLFGRVVLDLVASDADRGRQDLEVAFRERP
jgi:hypothetical protein